ncbi:RbsD/FucU domain-containing protein [Pedobacter glucosidilyticus]|uniref:RbsD/FucU domain-containing protein n=1 Tax=Pedobacter glucosidilyticus TaxID=1122941 RepID=UPI0003F52419|nr:RbsD/FucU domain-containing protein [Pedobacter glucosidilyticus]
MRTLKYLLALLLIISCAIACKNEASKIEESTSESWKLEFKKKLSEYGHRNWILIVDKAFPLQNSTGIVTIDTHQDLLKVLDYTLSQIDSSSHVKPLIYTDKELNYISKEQVENIGDYRAALLKSIGKYQPQSMLHDSVFVNIDKASKLFKVLVLKTDEVIPYSSVFIQLDCKYWTTEKENNLRTNMRFHP